MSAWPDELARIDSLARTLTKTGQGGELEEWLKDPRSIAKCRDVLNTPCVPFHAACFSIQVLQQHIARLFDFWSSDDRSEFLSWYDSLLVQQYEVLWNADNGMPIYILYAKLYGMLLAKGWDEEPSFRAVVSANFGRFSERANYIFCATLGEMSQAMIKFKDRNFRNAGMDTFLRYCFFALHMSDDAASTRAVITAIENILDYEVRLGDTVKDEFPNQMYLLTYECAMACCTERNIRRLFEIAPLCCTETCLEIVTFLCSVNGANMPEKDGYRAFLNTVLGLVFGVPLDTSYGVVHKVTRLVLRLRIALWKFDVVYDLPRLLKFVARLTKKQMSKIGIENNGDTVQNLLAFWASLGNVNLDRKLIVKFFGWRMMAAVNFIEGTLRALSNGGDQFDNAMDMLTIDDTSKLDPTCRLLGNVLGETLPEFVSMKLPEIFRRVVALPAEDNAAQIAFLCNCMLGMANVKVDINRNPNALVVIDTVRCLFRILLLEVYRPHFAREYIVLSLITFVRQFKNYDILAQPSSASTLFYKGFQEIGDIETMLNFLLRIVWEVLASLEDHRILLDATLALSALLDERNSFGLYLVRTSFLPELIKRRVERPFAFLAKPGTHKIRVSFHKALCRVLVLKEAAPLRQRYLSVYNHALVDGSDEVGNFLGDFTGFFEGVTLPAHFAMFFDYVFPARLERLIQIAGTIRDVSKAVHIVRMWSTMLSNATRRIKFRHHSPNGVMLFNMTSKLLCQFDFVFEIKSTSVIVGFMKACYRVMHSALDADYVPFNIYAMVGDESLNNMLRFFVKCAAAIPADKLSRYQKSELELQRANAVVVKRHVSSAGDSIHVILDVTLSGLQSLHAESRGCAVTALEQLVFHHYDLLSRVERGKFIKATFRIWHLCFEQPDRGTLLHCLGSVICRDRDAFERAFAYMMERVIPKKADQLQSQYSCLATALPALFVQKESGVISALESFILCARACVTEPNAIFNI